MVNAELETSVNTKPYLARFGRKDKMISILTPKAHCCLRWAWTFVDSSLYSPHKNDRLQ